MTDDERLRAADDFVRGVFAKWDQRVPEKKIREVIVKAAKSLPPFTRIKAKYNPRLHLCIPKPLKGEGQ